MSAFTRSFRDCLGRLLGGADRWLRSKDKDIDFELNEFGHKAWDTVRLSFNVAILHQDIFLFNIAEISQPLPESLNLRPRSLRIAGRRHISHSRNLRRLLRLSHHSGHHELEKE